MIGLSNYNYIKTNIDNRETFAYQDCTEYPTLKINNTIATTSFTKDKGEYVVGIEIDKVDGTERKLVARNKDFKSIFGTYTDMIAYLRLNGFYRFEQLEVEQITIFDILD